MVHLGGGWLREFEYCYNGIVWLFVWDPNKAIGIREWLICAGSGLERFYCTTIFIVHGINYRVRYSDEIRIYCF